MKNKFITTALGLVLAVTISGCANTSPIDGGTKPIQSPITEVTGEGGVLGAGINAPELGEKVTITSAPVNAPVTDVAELGNTVPAPAVLSPTVTTQAHVEAPVAPQAESVAPVIVTPVEAPVVVAPTQAPVVSAPVETPVAPVVTAPAETPVVAPEPEASKPIQDVSHAINQDGIVTGEIDKGVGTSRTVTTQGNGLFLCEDGNSLFYSGDCLATWNTGKGEVPRGAAITPKGAMSSVGVARNADGSFDCTQNIVVIGFNVPDCAVVFSAYNGGK